MLVVIRQGSPLLAHGDRYCDITCHDLGSFRRWPDREVDKVIVLLRETCKRANDGLISKAKAEEIQQACGLNYHARGLLASDKLRASVSLIGAVTYDWVHTLLQDGVFVIEASLIVKACGEHTQASSKGEPQVEGHSRVMAAPPLFLESGMAACH